MTTLAELGLSVSASGVQQGLSEAQKQFKKFQEDTSSTAEIMRKGFELVKLALEAVAAVETVRHILEVTDAFRQMQQQLTAVTGSASAGRQALAWVDEFASKTPYSMQTVTKAFQDLWSVGINPMTGALQTLADANAAVGGTDESLQRLVQTIAMMKEQGVVNLRELQRTLQNEIPGAAEIMARQMGMSMGELDRVVKAGALTSQQAIDALLSGLSQKFGGAALAQMHTFAGAWKELKDAADELFRALGEAGVTELAIQAIGAVSEGLKLLTEHVGEARDVVIDAVNWTLNWVRANQSWLQVIVNVIEGLGGVAVAIAADLGIRIKFALDLVTAFATGTAGIKDLLGGLWDWILAKFEQGWGVLLAQARATWENLRNVFNNKPYINVGQAGSDTAAMYQPQIDAAVDRMANTGIARLTSAAAGQIAGVYEALSHAVQMLEKATLPGFETVLAKIKDTLGAIRGAQGSRLGLLPAGPGEGAFSPSSASANAPWATFIQQLQNIFAGDAPFLQTLQQIFSDQGTVGQALDALGAKALGGMGKAGSIIKDGLSALSKGDPVTAILTVLMDILEQLKFFKVFSDDLNKLLSFFESAFDPLADIMTAIFNVLSEPMQVIVGIIKPVMQGIASIVTPVIQEVASLLAQILGVLGIQVDPNSMTALANIAANPTVTLRLDTSAAMQSLQRAEDAMLGAANASQREIARQSYISARDAAVLAEQNQAGQQTGLQPASFTGFIADIANILNQVLPVLQDVWNFLSGVFAGAVNVITSALGGIYGYLQLLPGQLAAMFSQLWAQISTIPSLIATALGSLFTEIAQGVANLIQPITDITSFLQNGIGNDLTNIFNAVQPLADAIDSLVSGINSITGGGNGQYVNVPGIGHVSVDTAGSFSQAGATPASGGSVVFVTADAAGNITGQSSSASISSADRARALAVLQNLQKLGYIIPILN